MKIICVTCGKEHKNQKQKECGACRGKRYNFTSKKLPVYVSVKDRGANAK